MTELVGLFLKYKTATKSGKVDLFRKLAAAIIGELSKGSNFFEATHSELSRRDADLADDWGFHARSVASNLLAAVRYVNSNTTQQTLNAPFAIPVVLTLSNKTKKPIQLFPLRIKSGSIESLIEKTSLLDQTQGDIIYDFNETVGHDTMADIHPMALFGLSRVGMAVDRREIHTNHALVRENISSSLKIPPGQSHVLVYLLGSISYWLKDHESDYKPHTRFGRIMSSNVDEDPEGEVIIANSLVAGVKSCFIAPPGVEILSADPSTITDVLSAPILGTRLLEQYKISEAIKEYEPVKDLKLTLHLSSIGASRMSVYSNGVLLKTMPISLGIQSSDEAQYSQVYAQTICDMGFGLSKAEQHENQKFPQIDLHFVRTPKQDLQLVN